VGDRTGLEMIRTLQDHGIHQGIDFFMEHAVLTLLTDSGRVVGVLTYDLERGLFHLFKAKAVILATGGVGRAYKITSNSWEYTGDGHALAYHAGAELLDMEYLQFHPTGMIWPPSVPMVRLRVSSIMVPAALAAPPAGEKLSTIRSLGAWAASWAVGGVSQPASIPVVAPASASNEIAFLKILIRLVLLCLKTVEG